MSYTTDELKLAYNIFQSKIFFIVFEYTYKSIKMINHHLLRDYQGGRKTDHAENCHLALLKKKIIKNSFTRN